MVKVSDEQIKEVMSLLGKKSAEARKKKYKDFAAHMQSIRKRGIKKLSTKEGSALLTNGSKRNKV